MKNKTELEKLGKNLKEARENAGFTQKALAEIIGISSAVLSKYENGELSPDKDVLIRISEVLGVSINMITMKFEDSMYQENSPLVKD